MTQKVYGMTDVIHEVKRMADAIEEILRLVKKDMEPRTKEKDEVYIETLNGPELREKN